jgi:putative ABC transport system substrate-binding protein
LAHPGGNVTGISDDATELSTKRLGLLKESNPGLRRVAMLWNANDRGMSLRYRSSAQAAAAMGIIVQPFGVREPDDLDDAFKAMTKDEPQAILMIADALVTLNRHRVIDFAAVHRLPAIYEYGFYVRDGGLMSYGVDLTEAYNPQWRWLIASYKALNRPICRLRSRRDIRS